MEDAYQHDFPIVLCDLKQNYNQIRLKYFEIYGTYCQHLVGDKKITR